MSSIYDFLNTEASSSTTGGVNAAEGQDPSTVNDGIRQLKQLLAAFTDDLGAVNTVGGTGDAITVTLGLVGGANSITAYATGQIFRFIAGAANTGAATMNVNSIGAKAIRKISGGTDVALSANDILAGETYLVRYSATANSSAGAWILVGLAASVNLDTLWAKGSDVASAATVSLGAGNFFHITGTTTITDIDFSSPKDGRMAWLEFDGALTLTHNGTTLNIPGGANITTTAGDRAVIVQDNSDNVHVLMYQRAGAPPVFGPHVILEDQKAQNTGGGTFTSGADQTRDLNTEVYDPFGYCSLSSNRFTLPAGTWFIRWEAPASFVNQHQSMLYNQTDGSIVARGASSYSTRSNTDATPTTSAGSYTVTITGSKAFEIRHRGNTTQANNGFGIAANFSTEVYTRVEITKVA